MSSGSDMVLLEYIGTPIQKQRLRSKVVPQHSYIFSGSERKFYAYRGDVAWLTNLTQFKLAPQIAVTLESTESVSTISSDMWPAPKAADLPLDALTGLDEITLGLLKKRFLTINELRRAGRAELLTIKGMGAIRADKVEAALNAIH